MGSGASVERYGAVTPRRIEAYPSLQENIHGTMAEHKDGQLGGAAVRSGEVAAPSGKVANRVVCSPYNSIDAWHEGRPSARTTR
jgi:hypothetical protein